MAKAERAGIEEEDILCSQRQRDQTKQTPGVEHDRKYFQLHAREILLPEDVTFEEMVVSRLRDKVRAVLPQEFNQSE